MRPQNPFSLILFLTLSSLPADRPRHPMPQHFLGMEKVGELMWISLIRWATPFGKI